MSYVNLKREELTNLVNFSKEEGKTVVLSDNIIYTKDEIKMMINRVSRQINGHKRLNTNLSNGTWTKRDQSFYIALATKEFEYFLEVENKVDSFTSSKLLSTMTENSYEKVFSLIKNINAKISKRSSTAFKEQWIKDRTFELCSSGEVDKEFNIIPESVSSINCLDVLMSSKMSKSELVNANLWKDFSNVDLVNREVFELAGMIYKAA